MDAVHGVGSDEEWQIFSMTEVEESLSRFHVEPCRAAMLKGEGYIWREPQLDVCCSLVHQMDGDFLHV